MNINIDRDRDKDRDRDEMGIKIEYMDVYLM